MTLRTPSQLLTCMRRIVPFAALCAILLTGSPEPADAAQSKQSVAKARTVPGSLGIAGTGAAPGAVVSLNVITTKFNVTARADQTGAFAFNAIPYNFKQNIDIKLSVPVSDGGPAILHTNTVQITLAPGAYSVRLHGVALKASSVALNVAGGGATGAVANSNGYFFLNAPVPARTKLQGSTVTASIINARQVCCPRTTIPVRPLTISLRGSGLAAPKSVKATPLPSAIAPKPAPGSATPATQSKTDKPATTPVKPAPSTPPKQGPKPIMMPSFEERGDISRGTVEYVAEIQTGSRGYAATATGTVDGTWVDGAREMADALVETLAIQGRMIGGFVDAQVHTDAQLTLQRLTAKAMKDYVPGEQLCRFGTMSRSLAASEGISDATKRALNEVLIDRETQRLGTINSHSVGQGIGNRSRRFQARYCKPSEENTGLRRFCEATAVDTTLNRDVDYTRALDVPMTLGINFVTAPTPAEINANSDVIALANNLIGAEGFKGLSEEDFRNSRMTSDDVQDYRSMTAARGVARNSLVSYIGSKAPGSGASAASMRAILAGMGIDAANAQRLIGANPSYFAQMDILTKKIYQDPTFYAELYDKPANVDRQRAAMRAINLQQDNDLLKVIQRREMLLSTLLELKMRNAGK